MPAQEMWAKLLFLALIVIGLASVPRVAVGKFRMRRNGEKCYNMHG